VSPKQPANFTAEIRRYRPSVTGSILIELRGPSTADPVADTAMSWSAHPPLIRPSYDAGRDLDCSHRGAPGELQTAVVWYPQTPTSWAFVSDANQVAYRRVPAVPKDVHLQIVTPCNGHARQLRDPFPATAGASRMVTLHSTAAPPEPPQQFTLPTVPVASEMTLDKIFGHHVTPRDTARLN
jgi:hypothetical protein